MMRICVVQMISSRHLPVIVSMFICIRITWQTSSVVAYKILMITLPVQSHVLPMLSIADGLAARGHEVRVLVNKNIKVEAPRSKDGQHALVTLEPYDDGVDVDAMLDKFTMMAINRRMNIMEILPMLSNK